MRLLVVLLILMQWTASANVKAVLFDCDGTLVDSEYAHYLGWKQALKETGSDLTLDEYYPYVGLSAEVNAIALADKAGIDVHTLIARKRIHYRHLCMAGLPPITETVNFLKELAIRKESLGIKIGVCSAAKKQDILTHLKHLEIDHLLDVILSGQEDLCEYSDPEGVNKPKPYVYQHAMKLLGTLPHETVVIEDSGPGATAGVSAGCFTIAIPNEYTKHHDFSFTDMQMDSFKGIDAERFFQMVSKSRAQ